MEIEFNNLIVFPTSRAIREYVNSKKDTNQFICKTITIGDFFSNVVINSKKTLISNDLRILYLNQAITNIDIKKLGLFDTFSKFYTQSEYIFKFFNELNSEFKTIDDIQDSDTYTFYLEHLEILKSIYKEYTSILDKNHLIDSSILKNNYELNYEYIKNYQSVLINYEGYFSSFEYKIINEVAKYTNLQIHMTINKFNEKNIKIFESLNLDLQIDKIYKLDITNKVILEEKTYSNNLDNHNIYPISQRIQQIAFVKFAIVNMIKNNIDPSKIALILPDEKFKTYLKIFDDEKYFNFAMGNDIKNSITYKIAYAISNYFISDEQKDTQRLEFFDIDLQYVNKTIKNNWNKILNKDIFFDIIDFIIKDEKNEDIVEQIILIKLSLNNLLFLNNFDNDMIKSLKLKDAYKLFLNKLSKISLDDVRSGKITVIGILETRGISFDGVIVIDFNDDKVPKRSIKDKFISSNVKEKTNLPSLKDRQNLQKYYYKRLFDNAKQISISYVNDESNTISRFCKQLFLKQNIINANFSNVLNIQNNINLYDEDIYMDIDLSKQEWSATSLKTYLQCKRMYYFNYILKIKEHDISLKPASYEIGSILHDVLENIYKNNTITYEDLCKQINKYQNKNPYLSLELEIWKKKLKTFINKEQNRFINENISIYALEMPFKIQYNNITIKGVIDRIDKLNDGTYSILDYKTSSSLKIDTFKTVENANDFQLEFYYLARRDLNISKIAYYDLNDASIKEETLLDDKIKILDNIFKSLNTKRVNFKKCEDKKACTFCIYKTICGED